MSAAEHLDVWIPIPAAQADWADLAVRAPQMTATLRRYLIQLTTFLAPRSVDVADSTLRQFARWLVESTDIDTIAEIRRSHIEDYKVWLAAQPGTKAPTLAKNTQRQRLRTKLTFLTKLSCQCNRLVTDLKSLVVLLKRHEDARQIQVRCCRISAEF